MNEPDDVDEPDLPERLRRWSLNGRSEVPAPARPLATTAPAGVEASAAGDDGAGRAPAIRPVEPIAVPSAWRAGRRHLAAVAATVALLVTVAGATAWQRSRIRTEDVRSPAAQTTTTTTWTAGPCTVPEVERTPEAMAEANRITEEAVAEAARTGWARFTHDLPDGTWICGWVTYSRTPTFEEQQRFIQAGQGKPVYDAPDGTVMGYLYFDLGYLPAEQVEAPGFDVTALRIQTFGCDPTASEECNRNRPAR